MAFFYYSAELRLVYGGYTARAPGGMCDGRLQSEGGRFYFRGEHGQVSLLANSVQRSLHAPFAFTHGVAIYVFDHDVIVGTRCVFTFVTSAAIPPALEGFQARQANGLCLCRYFRLVVVLYVVDGPDFYPVPPFSDASSHVCLPYKPVT